MKATRYNKSEVMKRAWVIYRNHNHKLSWSDSLRQSWCIEKNGVERVTFNQLYSEYYKGVYNYIMNMVNFDHMVAEEIANDVFVKVNEHIENYDVYKAKANTWIYTIAKRKVIDFYRADKSNMTINVDGYVNEDGKESFVHVDESQSTEGNVEGTEIVSEVKKAMSSLNDNEQVMARMFFIEQKKYKEISETMDISIGSVKGTLSRIRAKLQDQLAKTYANM